MTNARWNRSHGRDTDRKHVRLQNIIKQRRLAGADSAEDADLKRCAFHAIEEHAQRPAKFDQPVRRDDPFNFAEQTNLVASFA